MFDFCLSLVLGGPFHVENLRLVAHKFLRRTVTGQTPFHLQRRSLIDHGHLIDAAMTGRAADAFVHVNTVIEINVVRKIVHTRPLQRLARSETGAHRLEIGTVRPNLLVAIHADRGRGDTCGSSRFNRRMAVAAIDPIVACVMFVAELNGLLNFNPLAGVPGRTTNLGSNPQGC